MESSVVAANLSGCFSLFVCKKSNNIPSVCDFCKQAIKEGKRTDETILRFDESKQFWFWFVHSPLTTCSRVCLYIILYCGFSFASLSLLFPTLHLFAICNFYLFCFLYLNISQWIWNQIKSNQIHIICFLFVCLFVSSLSYEKQLKSILFTPTIFIF